MNAFVKMYGQETRSRFGRSVVRDSGGGSEGPEVLPEKMDILGGETL